MTQLKRSGGNGRRAQCVQHANTLYTSGITSTNLAGNITEQAQEVLALLDSMLARHGTDKTHVLQATITLADMADYGDFNAVWDEWVLDGYEPARSVTGGALAVPEYRVKIAVIAAV